MDYHSPIVSHSSGLSYGLFDPGSVMFKAYQARRVLNPTNLADIIDALAELPLVYHPGFIVGVFGRDRRGGTTGGSHQRTAVRHVHPVRGFSIRSAWWIPAFVVPEKDRGRFVAYYAGADLMDPMKPGLTRTDNSPWPGAYLRPEPWLSGGGGLVSSLPDMVALVRSLLPGGPTLLKPETIAEMMTNQLPDGVWMVLP